VVILHDAHKRHDGSPGHHDGRQPDRGAEPLQQQVGGHFEGAVGEEEDWSQIHVSFLSLSHAQTRPWGQLAGQAQIVLIPIKVQIRRQALDLRVSNVPYGFQSSR
jgi:hypothetical protein